MNLRDVDREIDTSDSAALDEWGISDGVYLEGESYRPHEPPFTREQLREDLLRIAAEKGLGDNAIS